MSLTGLTASYIDVLDANHPLPVSGSVVIENTDLAPAYVQGTVTALTPGANALIGSVADTAATDPTAGVTLIGALKGILKRLLATLTVTPKTGAKTFFSASVTASNSPTPIVAANPARVALALAVSAASPNSVFVCGPSAGSSASGVEISPGMIWHDLTTQDAWYAILPANGATVIVTGWEVN